MAGKATYEIICSNLPIPKAKTIGEYNLQYSIIYFSASFTDLMNYYILVNNIHEDKKRIIEGELRCQELVTHLEPSKYSKSVFLSEYASGVVHKVVFDSRSNQLVGLVLPLNQKNGMPQLFSFKADSAEDIEKYMKLPQSKLVYIIVAQPLVKNAIPFIIQIFGTNNQFKSTNVLKRWDHTNYNGT